MTVHVTRDAHVTIVTLDRPDVRNAVDADTARALYAAFVAFDEDPDARVAVFHGAHGHFCAGWDLQFGARMAAQSPEQGHDVLGGLHFSHGEAQELGQEGAVAPLGPWGLRGCC